MDDRMPSPNSQSSTDTTRPGVPRVLSIAGTDPSGGAGAMADIKSISAQGGYALSVITALVAQNTQGVRSVHEPPVGFLREQLDAVRDDVELDAIKIGMLGDADIAETVHGWLTEPAAADRPPLVLDPVMVATSGDRLLDPRAEGALRELLPVADLITPNIPELAVLAGVEPAEGIDAAIAQARAVSERAGVMVLVKGGHLHGDRLPNALVDVNGVLGDDTEWRYITERVDTVNTHGTGCSISSAIATLYARTGDWRQAVRAASDWLTDALRFADDLHVGRGHGPINHFHDLWAAAGRYPEQRSRVPSAPGAAGRVPTSSS